MLIKQDRTCFYCQRKLTQLSNEDWQIDHIVAIDEDSRHTFTSDNLILSCKWCNRHKKERRVLSKIGRTDRYSRSSANYKIVHPRLDRYSEHFQIIGGKIYIGLTQKGKTAKEYCNLDRIILDHMTGLDVDNSLLVRASLDLLFSDNPRSLIVFLQQYDKNG
nr:HNH endonuclease [Deinococcus xianganensis]